MSNDAIQNFSSRTPHVYISGTGRAGTTFLVSLLTHLGVDTGFFPATLSVNEHARAGLEISPRRAPAPYIVKSPYLCDLIDEILARRDITVEHVIVPMRDLQAAAESRRYVQQTGNLSDPALPVPGGLWETLDPSRQEDVLLRKHYNLIRALVQHDIPMTFLFYPRLVLEPAYLYEKLGFLLGHIPYAHFENTFQYVRRPEWIHQFSGSDKWGESPEHPSGNTDDSEN